MRNSTTFQNVFLLINVAIRRLCLSIKKADIFRIGFMDNSQLDLITLRCLGVSGIPKPLQRIYSVIWVPPPVGWVKINTDGAAKGSPGLAGAGGIFKLSDCSAISSFAVPLGPRFAHETELFAVIFVIVKA